MTNKSFCLEQEVRGSAGAGRPAGLFPRPDGGALPLLQDRPGGTGGAAAPPVRTRLHRPYLRQAPPHHRYQQ